MATPKWHVLTLASGAFNSKVRDAAHEASGAYAIRRADTHEVVYVGESSRGAMWRTLLRHFQGPASFKKVREGFVTSSPVGYEVALHVTSRGARARDSSQRKGKRPADQRASEAQARWIATLHPTTNKDDGKADVAARELRELRSRQAAEDEEGGAFGSLLNPGPGKRKGRALAEYRDGYDAGKAEVEVTAEAARKYLASVKPYAPRNANYDYDMGYRRAFEELVAADEADQLPLFGRAKNPPPQLIELGRLTRLDLAKGLALAWSVREAPILAYDPARVKPGGGCLVICYRGPVVSSSSAAELKEFGRKHWGAAGPGDVRECGHAPSPFRSLGESTAIVYTTRKGRDSALIDYVHPWGEGSMRRCVRPVVQEHVCQGGCRPTCAARGSIRLLGGTYSLEDRGIVG